MELAKHLRIYADSLAGKEQLAVMEFARAIEVVPRTLAESAGLDPIDKIAELKSAHDKSGGKWMGVDVFTGRAFNAWEEGVIEPLRIKTQAVKSASEVAVMILRIDDVVMGQRSNDQAPPPGAMPY